MSNYQLGKIYKLQHRFKKDLCYVGSTGTTLECRLQKHKVNSKYIKPKKYKIIEEEGGWENFEMILIKEYPCNDKEELRKEEQRCIDDLQPTLNTFRAYRTEEEKKEYIKKEIYKKRKIKTTCECGRAVNKGDISTHMKSKIHIKLMEKTLEPPLGAT